MMGEVIKAAELEETKKHNTFHVDVITGRTGDYATNAVTGQVQKTLPATVNGIDWTPVGNLTNDNCEFTKSTDYAVDDSGTQWAYNGVFPFISTAPVIPSAPDYYVVHVSEHNALSNRNAAGAHDAIYSRSFATVASMVAYAGHQVGYNVIVNDGLTSSVYSVDTTGDIALTGGLYATKQSFDASHVLRKQSSAKTITIPASFPQGVIDISYAPDGGFKGEINLSRFDVVTAASNTKHYYVDSVNGSDSNDGLLGMKPSQTIVTTGLLFSSTSNYIEDYSGELLAVAQVGNSVTITTPLNTGTYTFTSIVGNRLYVSSVASDEAYPIAAITRPSGSGPVSTMTKLTTIFTGTPPTTPIHIHIADGPLTRDFSLSGFDFTYNVDLKISAETNAVLGFFANLSELTWVASGSAWTASRSGTYDVFDYSMKDANGIPFRLTKMNSVAEVQSTPNSWFISGADVTINLADGRDPNGDRDVLLAIGTGAKTHTVLNNRTIYLENIDICWGAAYSYNSDQGAKFIADNCVFFGNRLDNGLSTASFETVITNNCKAAYNFKDGLNHHAYTAGVKTVYEIDCVAHSNGLANGDGINNGSTCHDGMNVIRVNTVAYDCDGPIIVDVNGCNSFNIGCVAGDSKRSAGDTKASFYFNDVSATAPGETWLIACDGGGVDTYSVSSDLAHKINIEDWRGTYNFLDGVI